MIGGGTSDKQVADSIAERLSDIDKFESSLYLLMNELLSKVDLTAATAMNEQLQQQCDEMLINSLIAQIKANPSLIPVKVFEENEFDKSNLSEVLAVCFRCCEAAKAARIACTYQFMESPTERKQAILKSYLKFDYSDEIAEVFDYLVSEIIENQTDYHAARQQKIDNINSFFNSLIDKASKKEVPNENEIQHLVSEKEKKLKDVEDNVFGSNLSQKQIIHLQAELLKLMSFPSGRHMIAKIVNEKRKHSKLLFFTPSIDWLAGGVSKGMQELPESFYVENNIPFEESLSPTNQYDIRVQRLKQQYKNPTSSRLTKGKASNEFSGVRIGIEDKPNRMYIMLGKKDNEFALSVSPDYRALFHEMTHAVRTLRQTNKKVIPMPKGLFKELYTNLEEMWAIEMGNTSEKTLSAEDGLSERISHGGMFALSYDPDTNLVDFNPYLNADIDPKDSERDTKLAQANCDENTYRDLALIIKAALDAVKTDISTTQTIIERGSFYNKKFTSGELNEAHIQCADYVRCEFKKFKLEKIRADRTRFEHCTLIQACIEDSTLDECLFQNCNMNHSTLQDSSLIACRFQEGNLSFTRFINTDCKGSAFSDCNLNNANFEKSDLRYCKFINIQAQNINLSNAKIEDTTFENVDFTNANLQGLNFYGKDLSTCCLDGANLDGANFEYATLPPGFNYRNYRNTKFTGARIIYPEGPSSEAGLAKEDEPPRNTLVYLRSQEPPSIKKRKQKDKEANTNKPKKKPKSY